MAPTASLQASSIVSLCLHAKSPLVTSSRSSLPSPPPPSCKPLLSARHTQCCRFTMSAGDKEAKHLNVDRRAVGATALALAVAAAMVVPEIAEAAQPGVSPSLKSLLLSVLAGGVVLVGLGGAVAGVATFDPVKRS